jgi:endothelin-converting enzyme
MVGMGLRIVDYGALGSTIGHEMTHGFDTIGRTFDENGESSSWWSGPTLVEFENKTQCFVKQYDAFKIPKMAGLPGHILHVSE